MKELDFVPLPHNEDYELDLHRPYIDEIDLICGDANCRGDMKRVPEVLDGWFESSAMPFAEYHYPFENKEQFEKDFPEILLPSISPKPEPGFIICMPSPQCFLTM